ncbi:hypothetical protein RhiirA5_483822 [Rhizophagus irregularis]|uniref:Uncharacterized protein n=3 Tax=Rhizophagus irregularis TaxID=588596 RepID=A0A2I1F621_9GLOM|nr:hypothetical protein GLOIN_2v1719357 [Rhizophagus irregularis DAOM 181602=DAOM 197198]EXX64820.1 hypothetical protein RirG_139120 [Rhizophagus irregularis DAOM 197198w]PKC06106.1 hypothetical protein RhiirA5_483822 [Rhizophagus irregularis]PKC65766.1 hypothetical protein RhiirA1_195395 [Rhizophagus irregularis]PKY29803.1 hypothetical protein RhiirB3_484532 [Rhizophagus irregularis]POG59792.1 hypothetical protein GLOIN_2v1719357 [Rhizophagus irregularis DAOM 181602=DAOM 197198]|eukprot:XP_025166658.1 hypothetical protein GLOIN_2v1719357 [Rhizophagus irregularis DAOM 181602=DAOM 197198]
MASSSSKSSLSLKIPTLYALTIQEPFATCIIHGPKRLENRTYYLDIQQLISASNSKTNDGIWIAIHVSQSKRNLGPKDSTCAIIKYQCWSDLPSVEVMKQNCGKIIGLAKFFNCVEAKDVPDDNVWKSMEDDDGTCKTKHYCWMIDDVKVLDNPIKSKGSSGIWKVDDLISKQIWESVDKI